MKAGMYPLSWNRGTGANTGTGAPTANFTQQITDLSVQFTNTSFAGSDQIASYLWNFGDATTSTEVNPFKTYLAANDYVVRLTVTDTAGRTNAFSRTITVEEPAVPVTVWNTRNTTDASWYLDPDLSDTGSYTTDNVDLSVYNTGAGIPFISLGGWADPYGTANGRSYYFLDFSDDTRTGGGSCETGLDPYVGSYLRTKVNFQTLLTLADGSVAYRLQHAASQSRFTPFMPPQGNRFYMKGNNIYENNDTNPDTEQAHQFPASFVTPKGYIKMQRFSVRVGQEYFDDLVNWPSYNAGADLIVLIQIFQCRLGYNVSVSQNASRGETGTLDALTGQIGVGNIPVQMKIRGDEYYWIVMDGYDNQFMNSPNTARDGQNNLIRGTYQQKIPDGGRWVDILLYMVPNDDPALGRCVILYRTEGETTFTLLKDYRGIYANNVNPRYITPQILPPEAEFAVGNESFGLYGSPRLAKTQAQKWIDNGINEIAIDHSEMETHQCPTSGPDHYTLEQFVADAEANWRGAGGTPNTARTDIQGDGLSRVRIAANTGTGDNPPLFVPKTGGGFHNWYLTEFDLTDSSRTDNFRAMLELRNDATPNGYDSFAGIPLRTFQTGLIWYPPTQEPITVGDTNGDSTTDINATVYGTSLLQLHPWTEAADNNFQTPHNEVVLRGREIVINTPNRQFTGQQVQTWSFTSPIDQSTSTDAVTVFQAGYVLAWQIQTDWRQDANGFVRIALAWVDPDTPEDMTWDVAWNNTYRTFSPDNDQTKLYRYYLRFGQNMTALGASASRGEIISQSPTPGVDMGDGYNRFIIGHSLVQTVDLSGDDTRSLLGKSRPLLTVDDLDTYAKLAVTTQ